MEVKSCPHCQRRVMVTPDGNCPSCRKEMSVAPAESPAAPAGEPAAASGESANPFVAPVAPPTEPKAITPTKQPFSYQAARCSLFAPMILILMNVAINATADPNRASDLGRGQSIAIGVLSLAIQLLGLGFGLAGLAGGISRGAIVTIVMAALGVLINGGILAAAVYVVLLAKS